MTIRFYDPNIFSDKEMRKTFQLKEWRHQNQDLQHQNLPNQFWKPAEGKTQNRDNWSSPRQTKGRECQGDLLIR